MLKRLSFVSLVGMFCVAGVMAEDKPKADSPAAAKAPVQAKTVPAPVANAPTATASNPGEAAWDFDAIHSVVGFQVKHLGISNTRGHFGDVDTKVIADPKTGKLISVQGSIKVDSVDTGMKKRDDHLKSPDFFDAGKYPNITFVSKSIKTAGKKVTAQVDLTIRGITKTVTLKGEQSAVQKVNFGNGPQLRTGFTATGTIDRKEYGLSFDKLSEGVALVGDKVEIQLEIETSRPDA